ncbi:hypothetical protein SAMN05216589_2867 [Halopseudomonas bauzanensis]|uniref:Uncharacterized protein n=2 Tax=Halopseudomonas bauzanensis TaxID=653930 RepID=A0A1I4PC43_9GAMM|nr:hypothetical protein SAMN05216589_2867 [Halopseudomonas bauzanensis]SFM25331.1 hypothetical protein SAMN04487855_2903 [Halopseudomonas bauzanensis]
MTWTVKAIDRSILIWICLAGVIVIPMMIASLVFYTKGDSLMASGFLFSITIIIFLTYKNGMEKTVFVYRATEERLEICQWQDIPDLVFTFLKVFPFIVVGIILMALISNPVLSIAALAGPALVGILLASVGGDSNYKAMYKRLERSECRWDEVIEATLDTHHGLIALTWPWEIPQEWLAQMKDPEENHTQGANLYFRKDQQSQVIELIRKKLPPNVKIKEERIKYDFSG